MPKLLLEKAQLNTTVVLQANITPESPPALLLETGGYLLLENGGKILLENS